MYVELDTFPYLRARSFGINPGTMRVSVCLGAILIPEYLDFHSGYSSPRSRIAGIYFGIFLFWNIPHERALNLPVANLKNNENMKWL